MRKPESSNSNKDGPSFQAPRQRPNWFAAIFCFLLGTLMIVAFVDYSPKQSPWLTTNPTEVNLVGIVGTESSRLSFLSIGISAWLMPVFLLWFFYLALRNARRLVGTRLTTMGVCLTVGSGLMAMFESFKPSQYYPQGLGGMFGRFIYEQALKDTLGTFGTALLLGTLYVACLLFIFTRDVATELEKILAAVQNWREARLKRKAERLAAMGAAKQTTTADGLAGALVPTTVGPTGKKLTFAKIPDDLVAKPALPTELKIEPKPVAAPPPPALAKLEPRPAAPPVAAAKPEPAPAPKPAAAAKIELNIVKPQEPKKAKVTVPQSTDENYKFPPLDLLKERVKPSAENSEEEHRRNAENLLRILSEFGVEVTLGEIHVGPVITRYEVVPAAGVRVEKIAGLDKNIALGMRAQSVRILAPIPGKAAVGVEVPNQHPTPVGMREILESEDWAAAKADLPIALGKDVSGRPLVSDLAKMPHLLIAGATGSGKSVCINSIITSILYSKSPKDVRLLMVDPKVVELKIFNALPHMLIPVVTEPKKVPAALKWLLGEMEQRYQIFAKVNVRNILGFNARKKSAQPETLLATQASLTGVDPLSTDDLEIPARLPYIIAIIDELADLMMVAPAEIETNIARLAQLARAAGIHLIIATQRPSVNVITGVIKANLPSRIAFQVASQVDSRTILDTKGADTLIGRGDMLFSPPGTSRLVRAQGAFVSDDEMQALVDFLKVNGPPVYANEVQAQIDRAAKDEDEEGGEGEDGDLGDDEELYRQALEVLRSTRRASTSMIQRRLRVGYNRAARIMDLMEEKGVVGPENGSSPREILVDLDKV
ncbi:MAG: DNA translocase FtsK [Opitutaceae bacterium]|nr:DNA translocase FtsK [Opitutaceae bacterium]